MSYDEKKRGVARAKCEADHLFFVRYFFKKRFGSKFLVNWHHRLMADEVDRVFSGLTNLLIINVSPGSSKTEEIVIGLMARGLALNPKARFLHLSYSDDLALLNSQHTRELIRSEEFQELWPIPISNDTKSKKRWNVVVDGKIAGGVYATSLNGQVTGFRAGHMEEGFQGAIILDDPLKPEEAFSKKKLEAANRKLVTTIRSRRANPKTPIIIVMQRIAENDPTGFIERGGLSGIGKFRVVKIPALLSDEQADEVAGKYSAEVDRSVRNKDDKFSYWEYKEPVRELTSMESGEGKDEAGNIISRFVFNSQWQQSPVAIGGNIFKGESFVRYTVLPPLLYRIIYADTAQKTKEANDRSVFECWGAGDDGRIYLLDLEMGKWEAPELIRRARAFWAKHNALDYEKFNLGQLRKFKVEDKASGTGLIQTIKVGDPKNGIKAIPVEGIPRSASKETPVNDKLTRAMNGVPYIDAGLVCVPEDAPFTNEFIAEHEAFSPDMSHDYDDQIDPCLDAIDDMLADGNGMKVWESLGNE